MPSSQNRELARLALDQRLEPLRSLGPALARPQAGWVRAIRTALGMTSAQLGQRLGIRQPSVVAMEKAEADGRIGLDTLRRAAVALDCELVYALVPRQRLQARVEQRLQTMAGREHARAARTMALEGQYEPDPALQSLQQRLARLGVRERDLWQDD